MGIDTHRLSNKVQVLKNKLHEWGEGSLSHAGREVVLLTVLMLCQVAWQIVVPVVTVSHLCSSGFTVLACYSNIIRIVLKWCLKWRKTLVEASDFLRNALWQYALQLFYALYLLCLFLRKCFRQETNYFEFLLRNALWQYIYMHFSCSMHFTSFVCFWENVLGKKQITLNSSRTIMRFL